MDDKPDPVIQKLEDGKKNRRVEEAQKRKQELEDLLNDLDDDSELPSHRISNMNEKRLDLDDSDDSIKQIAYEVANSLEELKRASTGGRSSKLAQECQSSS